MVEDGTKFTKLLSIFIMDCPGGLIVIMRIKETEEEEGEVTT